MISIICTTHDGRKKKLERAIKSVIAQTFKDWELIIVDDASKDGTEQMVEKYTAKPIGLMTPDEALSPGEYPHDLRISYIRRTKNFGCDTLPKNRGIKAAKGEYIALIDSDVEYRPDHLQALHNEMKRTNVDVVYGDRFIYDERDGTPKAVSIGIFHDYDPFLLMRRNYIDTSDVLMKRESVFAVGGFDERYRKYIDWNLWVRMSKAGMKFKRVPGVITNYYIGADSKSERKEDEKGFSQPAWDAVNLEIDLPYIHTPKEPNIAIFSLTYDRKDMTQKCFESLYATAKYPFDHYIVDNGSHDGTADYVRSLAKLHPQWIKPILNSDNKGISIASNQAIDDIKTGDYDIIVKVDPDAMFLTDGWLKKMVELWKVNHMMVLSPYIQGLRDNPGGAPRGDYGQICGELLGLTKHIGGIVCFADASAYESFRWDEKQPLHGIQDVEFSTYVRQNGYQCAYMENYFVEHCEGTEGQHKKYPEYFERRKFEKSHRYGEGV